MPGKKIWVMKLFDMVEPNQWESKELRTAAV